MADSFKFPKEPPKEVVEFLERKKLKPTFDWREMWRQEHQVAFTVAKATQLDILQDIFDELLQAMNNGETFQTFQKSLRPRLQKKGWWGIKEMTDPLTGETKLVQLGSPRRLKLIYDTNLRTARAHGQWQRIQRSKKAMPYLKYEIGPSKEHRKEHVQWNGLCLPADDPFWDTHFPQNGWGCKCRVRQVSQFEYDRLDKSGKIGTQAPTIKRRDYINGRTGEISRVPEGIDPGWDYNPGKMRLNSQLTHLTDKLNRADYEVARRMSGSLVQSAVFQQWYQKPRGAFPVAVLPELERARIGARPQALVMSDETARKQQRVHSELDVSEYRLVQQTIDQGEVIPDGDRHLIYLHETKGYVTVVKATRTGEGLFLQSFRRLSSNDARRDKEVQRLRNKKR